MVFNAQRLLRTRMKLDVIRDGAPMMGMTEAPFPITMDITQMSLSDVAMIDEILNDNIKDITDEIKLVVEAKEKENKEGTQSSNSEPTTHNDKLEAIKRFQAIQNKENNKED